MNTKAPLVILRTHGHGWTWMTLERAGAMRASTWQTCRMKIKMVMDTAMVMVAAILIDNH